MIKNIIEFIGRFALGYAVIYFTLKEVNELSLESRIVGDILVFLIILWITIPILKDYTLQELKSKEKK
jgi:hypothetical protein